MTDDGTGTDAAWGAVAATRLQRGIWFAEHAGGTAGCYHMALAVRFEGPLDLTALRSAVTAVVRRHEVLGMVPAEQAGELVLVAAATPPRLELRGRHQDLVAQTVREEFDLRRGPLVRFVLAPEGVQRHVLVVVAHHLVFDGVSKAILVRDLAAAYNRVSGAAVEDRPEPVAGYRRAVAAQLARETEQLAAADAYWCAAWREPGTVALPDLVRTPVTAEPGTAREWMLGEEQSLALDRAAGSLGVTRFELLLTALQALLRRYGNRDAAVAVDLSTRTPANRDAVGPYVNELPVMAPALTRPTFREYALAVRATLRGLYPVRTVPLARVLPGMRPRDSLAPVSLSYRRQEGSGPAGEGAEFAGLNARVTWTIPNRAVRNALQIQMVDHGRAISVSMQYSPSAIPDEAVARVETHLRTLLAAVLADRDVQLDRIPLLGAGAEERRQVLETWNRTHRLRPPAATLVNMFRERVRANPDRTALRAAGRLWSYRKLETAADAVAATLHRSGVRRGDVVAVCLERSAATLAALLGVVMSGAAYLPVDPTYPSARRRLILDDARPALVLTDDRLATEIAATGLPVCLADEALEAETGGRAPERTEFTGPQAQDSAYVIYTSGSTGSPKGVEVPHLALANLLSAMREELGTTDSEVWLAHTSLSFDISALELFLPLVSGGCVVLADAEDARNPATLVALVRDHGVTHIQATPSGWRMLLDAGLGTAEGDDRLTALSGGEALAPGLADELRGRVSRLLNLYGPTETTIWSTVADLTDPAAPVSIGRPLANTQVYVCDEHLEPVPIGLPGELYIGGTGLARGYHGRPELTAERFVDSPFGPPGSRLYRTGDQASWRADGRLFFHGRTDDQVKIRGHRVELGEVEARLLEHPAVATAAVATHPDQSGQPSLVGYLVPRPRAAWPAPAELRAFLGLTLPAAMIPTGWVRLDALPRTPNGKTDRSALPPPTGRHDTPAPGPAREPITPAALPPLMRRLLPMWLEALQLDEVDVDDDLFDLGGHSLTVIQLIERITAELGVELPLDAFYDRPSVRGVAAAIEHFGALESEVR